MPYRLSSRSYTTRTSRHAQWYSDILPAMIPVALIGSTVYMALQLVRINLSHEQYLEQARARVNDLEARLHELQRENVHLQSHEPVVNSKKWRIFQGTSRL